MNTLAVVALSARVMAQAAAQDGYAVLAIDLFGDADTRRASQHWWPAGPPGGLRIDPNHVLAALRQAAQRHDVQGWVAGSGCEGQPALLAEAAAVLPLLGTAPQAVQRVRDPGVFFSFLAAHGIAHPPMCRSVPTEAADWLVKDAHGSGGWHIQNATSWLGAGASDRLPPHHYFQRRAAGVAMSATFCANGRQAALLGFNQLIVRPVGQRPFVYCGVVGPVPLVAAPARAVQRALQLLTAEMGLRGLCSLDFVLNGDQVLVLEVNPRVPASVALYGARVRGGVMAAHVKACQSGQLPHLQPAAPQAGTPAGGAAIPGLQPTGTEIVFAPRALHISAQLAQRLQARSACHDQPTAGTRLQRGDPLCSVSAHGANAEAVLTQLATARTTLLAELESAP